MTEAEIKKTISVLEIKPGTNCLIVFDKRAVKDEDIIKIIY